MDYDPLTKSRGAATSLEAESLTEETPRFAKELAILPTKGTVVFPYLIMPLMISDPRYARLIDEALMQSKPIGLFAQKNQEVDTHLRGHLSTWDRRHHNEDAAISGRLGALLSPGALPGAHKEDLEHRPIYDRRSRHRRARE